MILGYVGPASPAGSRAGPCALVGGGGSTPASGGVLQLCHRSSHEDPLPAPSRLARYGERRVPSRCGPLRPGPTAGQPASKRSDPARATQIMMNRRVGTAGEAATARVITSHRDCKPLKNNMTRMSRGMTDPPLTGGSYWRRRRLE